MTNKISILYILYTEEESKTCFYCPDSIVEIKIIKINPFTFSGFLGCRHDIVYCDHRFMDSHWGRQLVKECFFPLASLKNAQFIFLFDEIEYKK